MTQSSLIYDREGRFRSGWRVAIFLVLWTFLSGMLGIAVFAVTRSLVPTAGRPVEVAVGSAVSLIGALAGGWICGRWLEDLPFRVLGARFSRRWLRHLLVGLLVGGCSISLAVAIAASFGNFRLELNEALSASSALRSLAASFFVLSAAAAFEEAFFRGYMFQTLSRAGLAWLAIVLTAVFFGALHVSNPGSGLISTADTIIAGVMFGLAYLRSRDLWFAFGIHLMWNWVQGAVYGIEISGLTDLTSASIFREIDNGPEWLTGGSYGIEGGVSSTAALVITALFIYFVPLVRPDEELLALTSADSSKVSVF